MVGDEPQVTAIVVTRGDVDLTDILASLPFDDVIVWNNAEREDLACYGRFAAIAEARHELIYVQDDDIIVPALDLLAHYDGHGIVANKKPDEEWRFLGIGAFFHRDLADCFRPYTDLYGLDADFCRVADIVFAYQHEYRSVWVGYDELEWSRAPNRMYLQPGHYEVRERARDRVAALNAPTALYGHTVCPTRVGILHGHRTR